MSLFPEWVLWMEGLALAAIGVGWLLMQSDKPFGGLLFFGGLFVAAPMLLFLAATVMYGPFILLFQWLGAGGVLLSILIIVAAWFVWFLYVEYIKKSEKNDTASDIGEGKLKKCSTCGKLKPIKDFKDPKLKTGIGRKCLACKLAN